MRMPIATLLLAGAAAAQIVPGPIVLNDAWLRAEFALASNAPNPGQRLELRSLQNLEVPLPPMLMAAGSGGWGLRLARKPDGAGTPPWMELASNGVVVHSDPLAPIGTLDALALTGLVLSPGGDALAASWEAKVTVDGVQAVLTVRTAWRLDGAGPALDTDADLDVTAGVELPWHVSEVAHPRVLVQEFEGACGTDALLVPFGEGAVIGNPTEGQPGPDGQLLPAAVNRPENQPLEIAAYWDGCQPSRCLAVAPTDGGGNWKTLVVQAQAGSPGQVSLEFRFVPPDVYDAVAWVMPCRVRVGALEGDWWDVADLARKQLAVEPATAWYEGPVGSPSNTKLPAAARSLVAEVFLFNAYAGDNLDLLARHMLDVQRLLGADVLACFYGGWAPDRFGQWFLDGGYLPGRPSFAAAVREGQKQFGHLVMPYVQGSTVADCADPLLFGDQCDDDVLQQAQQAVALDSALQPLAVPGDGSGPPRQLFQSARSAWWLAFLPQHAADVTGFADAAAIYLDFFLALPDYDPLHDPGEPPPGGGDWMYTGRMQQLRDLKAARGPDFTVTAEFIDGRFTEELHLMHLDPAALLLSVGSEPDIYGTLVPVSMPNAHVVPFFRAVHDNVKLARILGVNAYASPAQRAWVEAVSVLSFGRIPSLAWSFDELDSAMSQRYPFASYLGFLGGSTGGGVLPGKLAWDPCDDVADPGGQLPPGTFGAQSPSDVLQALCGLKPRLVAPFHRQVTGLTVALRDLDLLTWHNGTLQRLPSYGVLAPPGFAGAATIDPDPADGVMPLTPVHVEGLPGDAPFLVPGMFRAPLDLPDAQDAGSLAFVLCNPWVDPDDPAAMLADFTFEPARYDGWSNATVYSVTVVEDGVPQLLTPAHAGPFTEAGIVMPSGEIRWWVFRKAGGTTGG